MNDINNPFSPISPKHIFFNTTNDQDDIFKNAKVVEKQDTSGRISLLFYGPCYSGKSQISQVISKMSKNETSGAFVGVGFFKKSV